MECPRAESEYCLRQAKQTWSPTLRHHPCTTLRPCGTGKGRRRMRHGIHDVLRKETVAALVCRGQARKPEFLAEGGFAARAFLSATRAWRQEKTGDHEERNRRRFRGAARI